MDIWSQVDLLMESKRIKFDSPQAFTFGFSLPCETTLTSSLFLKEGVRESLLTAPPHLILAQNIAIAREDRVCVGSGFELSRGSLYYIRWEDSNLFSLQISPFVAGTFIPSSQVAFVPTSILYLLSPDNLSGLGLDLFTNFGAKPIRDCTFLNSFDCFNDKVIDFTVSIFIFNN